MTTKSFDSNIPTQGRLREAARFWERLRIWYSGVLTLVLLGWLVSSWPHFRGSVGSLFLWLAIFLVIANVCYCAGYGAELLIQGFVPRTRWRGVRLGLWVAGLLLSVLVENYWIADEIYPYPNQGLTAAQLVGGGISSSTVQAASNLNFPAPFAVIGFLAAAGGLFVALAAILILWFARKPKLVRRTAATAGCAALIYFGLLLGFSAASRSRTLEIGQEKYFCEIDCHLAYSVLAVNTHPHGAAMEYVVTLQTRFDERTISSNRPKDAALMPSHREVRIVDRQGHEYAPVATDGTPLMEAIRPAESFTTGFRFQVPKDATGLRLLVRTIPAWPDHVVIGDENSWLHKKTYFAL